ncbi:MAG: hypothetical protein ACLPVY_09530 [Acidimicrobiia bacterium]
MPTPGDDEGAEDEGGAGFDDAWCGLALHAATTTRHTTKAEHRLTATASHAHHNEHRRMPSHDRLGRDTIRACIEHRMCG